MQRANSIRTAAVAAAMLLTLATGCMPYSTGPTEVGVRTKTFTVFGKKGVQDTIYPPGVTNWFVPFLNDWHTFDASLQTLEMNADTMGGDRRRRDDLVFKSIDGNDIGLDIVITFRIDNTKAPMILQHVATSDQELRDNIVRTVARSKPRDIFGELKTEEFYIAQNRTDKENKVRDALNKIMEPYGVIIEKVGTKDYRFNPDYEQAIMDKKVADQQAEKHKSSAHATLEEYETKVAEAEGENGKLREQADGEFERAKIEADAYYEQQALLAQAIEVEGRAEAEGIQKMNEALAGAGGDVMVKMKLAEALQGKRIVLLPLGSGGLDVRSTDINGLLQLYGIQSLQGGAK